jgi:acetyltransferase-like isoleucine patch superfamily enzyme
MDHLTCKVIRKVGDINSQFRIQLARWCGATIGIDCRFGRGVSAYLDGRPGRRGTLAIGNRCELLDGVALWPFDGAIKLADDIFIGQFAIIYGHGGVEIGDNTLVSMHCRILSSNHTIPPIGTLIRTQPDVPMPTRIGRDVWLGAGATVLGGVTIGDGCVVGAGAVITSDLPPFSIAVGVPARVVRMRKSAADHARPN